MKQRSKYIILAVIAALLLSTGAYAAGTKDYAISEIGMTLSIPDDLIVFTQDIDPDDPNLQLLNLDEASLEDYFKKNGIYLNAMPEDVTYEVVVTMSADSSTEQVGDFSQMSEDDIKTLEDQLDSLYTGMGFTIKDFSVYDQKQAKFVLISFEQPGEDSTIYSLQYYTIRGGKGINITLHSYSGEITDSEKDAEKAIVDSAAFTEAVNPSAAPAVSPSESISASPAPGTEADQEENPSFDTPNADIVAQSLAGVFANSSRSASFFSSLNYASIFTGISVMLWLIWNLII